MAHAPTRLVSDLARRIADLIDQAIREHLGPDATFEQRQDLAAAVAGDALWFRGDRDLHDAITTADEVEVGGRRYRRLEQASSATYHGRWGSHHIEEALYREVGVHNGPTIKPIELRVGIIEHMTPDMARVVGELSADRSSRGVERTLRAVGLVPPSRAFLAKHTTAMGIEIADQVQYLEQVARDVDVIPAEVASVSTGLDRMSVRMSEPAEPTTACTPARTEPYERTPPPPKEHHYRKAWVGSTSVYDAQGNELHTWRYAVEADADPTALAGRVAKDVAWIVKAHVLADATTGQAPWAVVGQTPACAASSQCEHSCARTDGAQPGSPMPRRTGRRSVRPHDQDRIRLADGPLCRGAPRAWGHG